MADSQKKATEGRLELLHHMRTMGSILPTKDQQVTKRTVLNETKKRVGSSRRTRKRKHRKTRHRR